MEGQISDINQWNLSDVASPPFSPSLAQHPFLPPLQLLLFSSPLTICLIPLFLPKYPSFLWSLLLLLAGIGLLWKES